MSKNLPLLQDSEKFAIIAMRTSVKLPAIFCNNSSPELWATGHLPLDLGGHWEQYIGSIKTEHFKSANLFLVAKSLSSTLDVLNKENAELQKIIGLFYLGLLLSARLTTYDDPIKIMGSVQGELVNIRQFAEVSRATPILGLSVEEISSSHLNKAAAIAGALMEWGNSGGSWRFNSILRIYAAARANKEPLERIHQFARCIDGLIFSGRGKGTKQFASRTEIFIGSGKHQLMKSIYEIRSAVEHVREYDLLSSNNRSERQNIIFKMAAIEHIARHCISHILLTKSLWPHFSDPAALEKFWELSPADQGSLWGKPIDLDAALSTFDGQNLNDHVLGLG